MALNFSNVNSSLYFACNTAANILLFLVMILPPKFLCLMCIFALFFSREINSKIRLLLVNIFTAEICNWISYTVLTVGWPVRFLSQETISCKMFIGSFIASGIQKFVSGAIYSVSVYIFIKYGDRKLKWKVILPIIISTWLVTIVISILPYFLAERVKNVHGFCSFDPSFSLFITAGSGILAVAIILLVVELIFCVLSTIFIKRNVLEESSEVKKAITKVLAFNFISSIMSFVNSVVPFLGPVLRSALVNDDLTGIMVINYVVRIIFNIPAIATPFIAILLLKPVRLALKAIPKKLCPDNRVHPTNN